jgi:hypothetical protein
VLGRRVVRRLRRIWQRVVPVWWGNLRTLSPTSRVFGLDRGGPVDRHYIEAFLVRHVDDICGRALEIADNSYTVQFGGSRVTQSDILHVVSGDPRATVVGDLSTGAGIPQAAFDCMILTQTLSFIYDIKSTVAEVRNALRPGGVALVTVPGISQISRYDMDRWGDYWRFTDASMQRLFGDVFGPENVTVVTYGNVLAACAFLHGLAAHELTKTELDYHDADYQLIIGLRAVRPLERQD